MYYSIIALSKTATGASAYKPDEGTVSNVIFSNILVDCMFYSDVWWGKAEPIYVTSYLVP